MAQDIKKGILARLRPCRAQGRATVHRHRRTRAAGAAAGTGAERSCQTLSLQLARLVQHQHQALVTRVHARTAAAARANLTGRARASWWRVAHVALRPGQPRPQSGSRAGPRPAPWPQAEPRAARRARVRELVLRRRCGPGPRGMHGAPAPSLLDDPRTVHSSLRLRARSRNMSESDTRHPAAVPTWCRGRISRHSRCRYLLGITSYQRPTCGLQNNPKDDNTIPENSFPEAEKSRKGR